MQNQWFRRVSLGSRFESRSTEQGPEVNARSEDQYACTHFQIKRYFIVVSITVPYAILN